MITKTSHPATKPSKHSPRSAILKGIPRRKEWRFELPLTAVVRGQTPQGKKFEETAKLNNISSTGAYFKLDSNVIIGSRITLVIDLPEKATDGKKIQLKITGITVRLEQTGASSRKQGVAVHFDRDYRFVAAPKRV
jgi:Tfp pilus assembly protein PilZ